MGIYLNIGNSGFQIGKIPVIYAASIILSVRLLLKIRNRFPNIVYSRNKPCNIQIQSPFVL